MQQLTQPSEFASASQQRKSASVFPNSIAKRLSEIDHTDIHNAINPLSEKDVDELSCLIKGLKRIKQNQSSHDTTQLLNKVEKFL